MGVLVKHEALVCPVFILSAFQLRCLLPLDHLYCGFWCQIAFITLLSETVVILERRMFNDEYVQKFGMHSILQSWC